MGFPKTLKSAILQLCAMLNVNPMEGSTAQNELLHRPHLVAEEVKT